MYKLLFTEKNGQIRKEVFRYLVTKVLDLQESGGQFFYSNHTKTYGGTHRTGYWEKVR